MSEERRQRTRFEPHAIKAKITPINSSSGGRSFSGHVIDSSVNGLAIMARSAEGNMPNVGDEVNVKISNTTFSDDWINIGSAKVVRTWSNRDFSGVALMIDEEMGQEVVKMLSAGPRKKVRTENQAKLAELDMDKVHLHVQYLHTCQLKLLIVLLTVSVAIGSAYLTLSYHSTLLGQPHAGELSYWRMWLASLPGILAIAIGSIIIQKISSVARNEAFLTVLKECSISGRYPREYKGWEDAYRKLKFCYKSKLCNKCTYERCGEYTQEEKHLYHDMKLMQKSIPNVFHLVGFGIMTLVGLLSFMAIVSEILKYKLENHQTLGLGIVFGGIIMVSVIVMIWAICQIRTGKYSFAARRRLWADILERCPHKV